MKWLFGGLFLICLLQVGKCSETCVGKLLECSGNACPAQLPAPIPTMVDILLFPVKPIADLVDGVIRAPFMSLFNLFIDPTSKLLSMILTPLKIVRFLMYIPFYGLTMPIRMYKLMLTVMWNLSSAVSPMGGYLAFTYPFAANLGAETSIDNMSGMLESALKLVQNPAEAVQLFNMLLPLVLGGGKEIFTNGAGEFLQLLKNYAECL